MKILICGSGQFFYYTVRQIASQRNNLKVICPDQNECRSLVHDLNIEVVWGDPTKEEILEEIGLTDELVVALFPKDSDNYLLSQLMIRKFRIRRIIVLVNNPANEEIFKRLGIGSVLNLPYIINQMVEKNAVS